MGDATRLLEKIGEGDPTAANDLMPLVYEELRRLAASKMNNEKDGHTLDATGLVHEAYLRLVDVKNVQCFNSRGHFFAAAAEAMRRILVERARQRKSLKQGGGHQRVDVDPGQLPRRDLAEEVLEVNEALEALALEVPKVAELVKLKYFAGFTLEEAATALGISDRTAHRHWAYAKAWLRSAIDVPSTKTNGTNAQ